MVKHLEHCLWFFMHQKETMDMVVSIFFEIDIGAVNQISRSTFRGGDARL